MKKIDGITEEYFEHLIHLLETHKLNKELAMTIIEKSTAYLSKISAAGLCEKQLQKEARDRGKRLSNKVYLASSYLGDDKTKQLVLETTRYLSQLVQYYLEVRAREQGLTAPVPEVNSFIYCCEDFADFLDEYGI